ncbi:MAG: DoxX family protein [Archangiaceae bacterium]|nr:DoxX family protein [Archangiaceae bacterium]
MPIPSAAPTTRLTRWAGWLFTTLSTAFLTFDAVAKLIEHPEVAKASAPLGIPDTLSRPIGLVLAACLGLTLIPRTAPLGAVLLTGFLGGAVFTHVRVGDPLFHTVFPIIVGAMVWAGLFLRDRRVRHLLADPKETR